MAWKLVPMLFLSLPCLAQNPVRGSETAVLGLRGPVHTVLTEYVDTHNDQKSLSTLFIYDPHGFLLEEYRYEADGAVSRHTKYTRDGWKVFKNETTSAVPSENRTFIVKFNSDGQVSGTETYDGGGALIEKTKNDFLPKGEMTSRTVKDDGTELTASVVESTDQKTGITHQTTTKDGKPLNDWLIQRDKDGRVVADRLTFTDGSLNESEIQPDGTEVEHRYWAPTKTHTYQTTDANNHVLEVNR